MLRWYKAQQCFQPSITETTHANSQYFVYTALLSFWMHGNKREQGSRLWTMPWFEASVILHFTVLFLIEAKVIVGLSIEMLKEAFFCLIGSWFHREGGKCSGLLMGDKLWTRKTWTPAQSGVLISESHCDTKLTGDVEWQVERKRDISQCIGKTAIAQFHFKLAVECLH